jgi:hypothetical protein
MSEDYGTSHLDHDEALIKMSQALKAIERIVVNEDDSGFTYTSNDHGP